MLWLLLLFGINLYFSWRYAPLDIDPDFALFNMAGQVKAWYGRDIVDCKSPLVHFYFWMLSKIATIVNNSVYNVRFLHYMITGLPGIIYYLITLDPIGALVFTLLIHSGHLYAFHGNVGDIPAGLIFLALTISNPWIAVGLFILAVLYEPKLIVAFAPWAFLSGLLVETGVYAAIGIVSAFAIWYFKHQWWDWLIEANIIVPRRMNKNRTGLYPWMPPYTSRGIMALGAWAAVLVINKPDLLFWIPPLIYLLFVFIGKVVRPNHLIPLVSWFGFAASGLNPAYFVALTVADLFSAGFYLGDIWARFYPGLRGIIFESRKLGEWLKDKPGKLWLNSMYSEIYIWSGKKPLYGMTEQVEINRVVDERRKRMRIKLAKNPPDWVVDQPGFGIPFDNHGYRQVGRSNNFIVYQKE